MPSRIGIVAGSGPGAALCWQTICAEAPARLGARDASAFSAPGGWSTARSTRRSSTLAGIVGRLRDRDGCDAVVLGCTELPLVLTPDACPLPALDSTRLLARAAIARALEA